MSELGDLYQEVILDHNKRPRNFRVIEGADRHADGFNPLCGDKVSVDIVLEGERIQDLAFQGSGCAISTASASMMTETLKGKTLEEANALFESFHALVTEGPDAVPEDIELGKLAVFSGVHDYPARVKCASLVWHTVRAALENQQKTVTTE
ncbi:MAG: SUF system NifU family Fe-S cluster assembly protein [Planctomycetota bacterium]